MADVLENVDPNVMVPSNETKEYQTLFWVPMLFQTAKNAELLIEEMLDMIQDFHDEDAAANRKSFINMKKAPGQPKRRQQILGDTLDSEAAVTRVDVVLKSENTKFTLLTVLKRHFLFSQLRDYELEDVIDVMQAQYASEGEVIIQQGDHGELFYILEEGTCQILIDGESLGSIESGSSFGDLALMYNCPRAATIIAVTDCTLWTLDRVFFRQAMVTSSSNQNVQLSQFLSKISLFASLGVQQLNQLARSLTKQTYEDGQYIIRQGDMGDQFYVIYKGKVIVSKTDDGGKEDVLLELGEGEVFGERALIKKEPRKANVIARGPVECYYLESQDFYSMLGEFVEKFNKMNEFRIIKSAKIFTANNNRFNETRLKDFMTLFKVHRMFSGQRLVCGIGEIFIVIDGQFKSTTTGERYASDGIVEIGSLEHTADEVAGALSLISDEGMLLSFTREQLLEAIKRFEEEDEAKKSRRGSFNNNNNTNDMSSPTSRRMTRSSVMSNSISEMTPSSSSIIDTEREIYETEERRKASASARRLSIMNFGVKSFDDVTIIRPLGKGTFGSVFLCQHNQTGKQIAIKCLNKKTVVENGQYIYVQREIVALQSLQHPFITDYFGMILSKSKICMILEYIPGGEFWSYLYDDISKYPGKVLGQYGGLVLQDSVLYAANIILALDHIHGLGYIYRDLKPENLMISFNGYLKLVDFGFAKQVPYINKNNQIQYRSFTCCGTPDYMAPELVLTQGHDKSADYWAFGILLYEILCGHTPFESSNQQRTFEKIVHSQKHLIFPPEFDPHAKSLIRRLLHPNAALRIGALQNGINDIINHAFFAMKNIDFDEIAREEIAMSYQPMITNDLHDQPVSSTLASIEPIDIQYERNTDPNDPYDKYFEAFSD